MVAALQISEPIAPEASEGITLETSQRITLEEYIHLSRIQSFEVIGSIRIDRMANVMIHVLVIKLLVEYFRDYEKKTQHGESFAEAPYVLQYHSQWVKGALIPDVMYYTADRLAHYRQKQPDWINKPMILVPDLAIEVVSSNDLYSHIQLKVETYLEHGVQLIWLIDPQRKNATIHQGNSYHTLSSEDSLQGGELLPDFELPLPTLFQF